MEAKELTAKEVEKAKNDAALAAQVCVQYKYLVKGIARKFFLQSGDEEDLIQEGMIGLYKAISKYDSEKGAFSTYATLCVRSEIINALRRSLAQKNAGGDVSIERSNLCDILQDEGSDLARIESDSVHEERLRNIKKVLSRRENAVLELFLNGGSYAQMAAAMDTNVKSIENSIKRIRTKLRGKILKK